MSTIKETADKDLDTKEYLKQQLRLHPIYKPKPQTFTLTLILENEHGFEKEKTIKVKLDRFIEDNYENILSFVLKGMVAIKNKKPYVSSRSKKSDY